MEVLLDTKVSAILFMIYIKINGLYGLNRQQVKIACSGKHVNLILLSCCGDTAGFSDNV